MTRLHRTGIALAGIVAMLLSLGGATPAFAFSMPLPLPPGGPRTGAAHPGAAAVRTIAAGGMPAWQVSLIAVAAALVAATAAVMLDRARTTRRQESVTHPRQAQPTAPH